VQHTDKFSSGRGSNVSVRESVERVQAVNGRRCLLGEGTED